MSRPLSILLVGPFPPHRGGIAHYGTRLFRELAHRGHRVQAIGFRRLYPDRLFPGSSQFEATTARTDAEFGDRTLDSIDPRTWWALLRRVRAQRPDRLVVQWWHPFFAPMVGTLLLGARRWGVPTTLVCHNVLPHESTPLDRVVARAIFRCADHCIVQARSEAERLRALAPGTGFTVVPHPIYDLFVEDDDSDEARRAAKRAIGWEEDEPLVLFFGLIRPYKGLDVLIRAMEHVTAEDPSIGLLAAGEVYGSDAAIRSAHDALPRRDRVRLELGYVESERMGTLFRAADVVALPYRQATQSGVIQTAYAAGRPVVSTRVGGLPDVVEDGVSGWLVEPEDARGLAAALLRALEPDEKRKLEAGVRRVRGRFTWSRLAEAIEQAPGVAQDSISETVSST